MYVFIFTKICIEKHEIFNKTLLICISFQFMIIQKIPIIDIAM